MKNDKEKGKKMLVQALIKIDDLHQKQDEDEKEALKQQTIL